MKNVYCNLMFLLVLSLSVNVVAAQTREEVVALVKQTKADMEENTALTLKKVNSGEHPYKDAKNPSLYVFIHDIDINVAAHAIKPHTVGKNLKGKPDIKGKMFRDEIKKKALANGKGWVDYYYLNPKNKEESHKESYFELVRGSDGKQYIVGSGKYFDK